MATLHFEYGKSFESESAMIQELMAVFDKHAAMTMNGLDPDKLLTTEEEREVHEKFSKVAVSIFVWSVGLTLAAAVTSTGMRLSPEDIGSAARDIAEKKAAERVTLKRRH